MKLPDTEQKNTFTRITELVLLGVIVLALALRTSFTETLSPQSAGGITGDYTPVTGIAFSGVLIIAALIWIVVYAVQGKIIYRFTGMEVPLVIFIIAAVISGVAAANKRAAITNSVNLTAPLIAALLVAQLLDTKGKIKLVLIIIASMGAVNAYQGFEQFFTGNEIMIQQYEESPEYFLRRLGIERRTLQHLLFEHRLYSRGVKGFLLTANSLGSFLLLAFFSAVAVTGLKLFKIVKHKFETNYLAPVLVILFLGIALFLTRSKGAITAFIAAVFGFGVYLKFSGWLYRYRRLLFVLFLLAVIAGGVAVTGYGLKYDELPGGKSMLVRWQYWKASAQMYADHFLFGVGPGNFAHYYTHYKPAAAIESVDNPHNFILNILTQYGILGLIGFSAALFFPLKKIFKNKGYDTKDSVSSGENFERLATVFMVIAAGGLLILRCLIDRTPLGASPSVILYVFFVMYVVPVIVFLIGFRLLVRGSNSPRYSYIKAAIFCAVAGCLLHNLVDFAIFEGGVLVTFWILLGVISAGHNLQNSEPARIYRFNLSSKVITCLAAALIVFLYFTNAFLPVKRSGRLIQKAFEGTGNSYRLFRKAGRVDTLTPKPFYLEGRFCLRQYERTDKKQLLERAADSFNTAVRRDRADYKNYEKLSMVYELLGKDEKAFHFAEGAVKRYPGLARLRFSLARIAEKLDKPEIALQQYKKAVKIERKYREQFRRMYPGEEVFSRLGEKKYEAAKERIKALQKDNSQ